MGAGEEREELIALIAELYPMRQYQMARKLGVSVSTVGRLTAVARERGLVPPSNKIKPASAREALIRDLAQPGWSPSVLARRHGYTKAGIYHQAIKHGYYVRRVGRTEP